MNVAFYIRHFTERGTEVAIYDYARYNEELLGNKSYIICLSDKAQKANGGPFTERISYDKFKKRFPVIEIDTIYEMKQIINQLELHFFYTLTHGGSDMYYFYDKELWQTCKTIKHCVFDTTCAEGDFYISISHVLNEKNNTNYPVIPHMIDLPACEENLRDLLGIPENAVVLGRYGGFDQFNIPYVYDAIIEYLNSNKDIYFLFMNTPQFFKHSNIIYVDRNLDLIYKTRFINTCDAMLHARLMGETFGLSIGEFSSKNKPIITAKCGDIEHLKILGNRALCYTNKEELLEIFKNIKGLINTTSDWNCYTYYTPENIMRIFDEQIFSRL